MSIRRGAHALFVNADELEMADKSRRLAAARLTLQNGQPPALALFAFSRHVPVKAFAQSPRTPPA